MGILASSQPLVDAVANDAINPQGGTALSMAHGGIAKFREGGANDLRRRVQYALSIKPDEMYETQGGNYTPDEEVLTLLKGLNPNDPIYADVVNAAKERGLPTPNMQVAEGPSALSSDQQAVPQEGRIHDIERMPYNEMAHRAVTPELLSEQRLVESADAPATFATEEGVLTLPDLIQRHEDWVQGRYFQLERAVQLKRKALDKLGKDPRSTAVGRLADWFSMSGEAVAAERLEEEEAGIKWREERKRLDDTPAEHWLRESGASEATIKHYSPEGEGLPLGLRSYFKNYWLPEEEKPDVATDVGTLGLGEEAKIAAQPAERPHQVAETAPTPKVATDVGTLGLGEEAARAAQRARADDDFSPAPDAPGRSVEDGVAVKAKYTRELTPLTNWLKNNTVTSADEIPASILSQSVDGIIDKAIAGIEGKTFDKEAFKAEIESLLPTVEDDPETEGLLIALLGASIMAGTSEHWAINVGKGIEKALPSLINFKNKKKEAERTRQMTIAKLTIEEGLSRDSDIRKAVGALEQSRTASQLSEAQRLLTPKDWWVSESITIPAELIGGKKGDPAVFLPQGSTLNLNQLSQDKLASLGVKSLPFDRGSWKLSDFISNEELMTAAEHVKAMNAYGDRVVAEVFKDFGSSHKVNFITSSPGALRYGAQTTNMINTSELQGFMTEYYSVLQPTINLRNDVQDILEVVLQNPESFTGKGLLLNQSADILRGMFGKEGAPVKWLEGLGADDILGPAEETRIRSIIVLAKLAPLLLDESGKTISDNDRRMIAGTLGLTMIPNDPDDPNKGFKIELNAGIFRNPQAIVTAIRLTEQALNRRLNEVHDTAKTHLRTFGLPASAEEMLELERRIQGQLERTKSPLIDASVLDFDLVGD